MRRYILPILCVCLAVSTVSLFALWQGARGDTRALDQLWQSSMAQACERFDQYAARGDQGEYWYGVAQFQSMVNSAIASDRPGRTDANAVCGALVYQPQLGMEHAAEIGGALSQCLDEPQLWEIKMNELRHLLEEG